MNSNVINQQSLRREVHEMTDHYQKVLEELKEKTKKLASQYVPKLYFILRNEEQRSPDDSRARIVSDCDEIWTKSTIERFFPQEAKNATKRKAGMISAQVKKKRKDAKLLVAVGGDVSLSPASTNEISVNNDGNSVEMNSTEKEKEEEALINTKGNPATFAQTSSLLAAANNKETQAEENELLHFQISIPANDVWDFIIGYSPLLDREKVNQVCIDVVLNKRTEKVVSARMKTL